MSDQRPTTASPLQPAAEPNFDEWAYKIVDKNWDILAAKFGAKLRDAYRWGRRHGRREAALALVEIVRDPDGEYVSVLVEGVEMGRVQRDK